MAGMFYDAPPLNVSRSQARVMSLGYVYRWVCSCSCQVQGQDLPLLVPGAGTTKWRHDRCSQRDGGGIGHTVGGEVGG
jgi:hypothetical protein